MPVAVVSQDTERHELKTCPEGFVELKRLTYGQFLERRDMATKMELELGTQRQRGEGQKAELLSAQQLVAAFEFKHCVVNHNLTNADGSSLDFSNKMIMTVLDPRIGQEIGALIDSMNQFEEEAKD